jgi:hypothetical protein
MNNHPELQKPIHLLLPSDFNEEEVKNVTWEQADLWQQISTEQITLEANALESAFEKANNPQKTSSEEKEAPKLNNLMKIWCKFWGRSALYFCLISFSLGSVLSLFYFYKLELNLDRLLITYIVCSLILWFCLTPLALYQSLKETTKR